MSLDKAKSRADLVAAKSRAFIVYEELHKGLQETTNAIFYRLMDVSGWEYNEGKKLPSTDDMKVCEGILAARARDIEECRKIVEAYEVEQVRYAAAENDRKDRVG